MLEKQNLVSSWFSTNNLTLNHSKTHHVFITDWQLNNNDLAPNVMFLGLFLESRLSWQSHVNWLTKRLVKIFFL